MAIPRKPLVPAGSFAPAGNTFAEAVAAERLRIAGILDSAEAKDRPAAAKRLALFTNMDVEAARGFLADLPAEPTAADKLSSSFLSLMDRSADALTVVPDLAGNEVITGDRKSARLKEIKAAGKAVSVAKGYRRAEEA